jgi:hypothetical protein
LKRYRAEKAFILIGSPIRIKMGTGRTGSFVLTSIIAFTNSLQGEVKITG